MAPGPWQILIIALIILLLFGATRLSEIGKGLGEGIRNFKKGIQDDPNEDRLAEAPEGKQENKQEKESRHLPPRDESKPTDSIEETDKERA